MAIPKRVSDRMSSGLKRLVPIIIQQRDRDVSETDTVTLIKDVLADVLGYDKYAEVTGEYSIRGTYCDLAVKLDDVLALLIEVKAIGITLNDKHLKQTVDYAANKGVEWVILTNGVIWQLHHVVFAKPIQNRLVMTIDITSIDHRKEADLERLFPITREGVSKGAPAEIRDRRDATSRFLIASLLVNNDSVLNVIRRELRRVVDVNVTEEEIVGVLNAEVIKRDALEGAEAQNASNAVRKAAKKTLRAEKDSVSPDPTPASVIETELVAPLSEAEDLPPNPE